MLLQSSEYFWDWLACGFLFFIFKGETRRDYLALLMSVMSPSIHAPFLLF